MKYIGLAVLTLFLGVSLPGCNGEEDDPESLAAIESRLEEKRKSLREIRGEIEELEALKAKLDTSAVESKPVRADTVAMQPFSTLVSVQGEAESKQNVILNSKTTGMAETIFANEGDQVAQGTILVKLDDEVLRSNIEEVQTSLELAATNYQKLKNLRDQNIGSEMQYLEAKNQKESLERKLATLNKQQDQTNIRAPFTGTVDDIFVKRGEMVMTASPVARLVNLEKVEIVASVSESYIGIVEKGDEVTVTFPSIKGLEKQGVITSVGQVINPNNRTFPVEVTIENNNRMVKPNMLASIIITDLAVDSAIVVPTKLIQQDRLGKTYLFVLDKNKEGNDIARKVYVTTGEREAGNTRILAGLGEGDMIITEGSREVSDGTVVSVKNKVNASPNE